MFRFANVAAIVAAVLMATVSVQGVDCGEEGQMVCSTGLGCETGLIAMNLVCMEPADDSPEDPTDELVSCETDEDCEGVFDVDSNFSANFCFNIISRGPLAGRLRGLVIPGEVGGCGIGNIAPPGP